jgi:protein-S-isoprenylcysteine O-methyltransferase Ste14
MFTHRQRRIALAYGFACHASFAAGIAAMIAGLYTGMTFGRGPLTGARGAFFDTILVVQFAVLHSFLLGARGRRFLATLVPGGIGAYMTTTTFAMISSLQIALVFLAWCPSGEIWWEPHGALRVVFTVAYASAWLLLLKAMRDAGLAIQNGSLGWTSVVRDHAPQYRDFPARGLFLHVRQPVYVAFALTLWTGPVWTPDHMLIAVAWTLYCLAGPVLKERRYLGWYGARFQKYRDLVPYWLPSLQRLDPALLTVRSRPERSE